MLILSRLNFLACKLNLGKICMHNNAHTQNHKEHVLNIDSMLIADELIQKGSYMPGFTSQSVY